MAKHTENEIPVLGIDYAYLAKKGDEGTPFLVSGLSTHGRITGNCLPAKGAEVPYDVELLSQII